MIQKKQPPSFPGTCPMARPGRLLVTQRADLTTMTSRWVFWGFGPEKRGLYQHTMG